MLLQNKFKYALLLGAFFLKLLLFAQNNALQLLPGTEKIIFNKNVDKSIDMKWEVVTENGVMYYTNHKPQIGDIAFCLGMDEEIVECDCKK